MGGKATGVVNKGSADSCQYYPGIRDFLKKFGVSCFIRFITVFMVVHFKLNNKNCTTTNQVLYRGGSILPATPCKEARYQAGYKAVPANR
jgi:hypothetical protein